jgi:hypothetical protein
VISDLSEEHRENFHVIRLNGFIHTDDKLALREIWRQLGREMEVEEDLTSKVGVPYHNSQKRIANGSRRTTMLIL